MRRYQQYAFTLPEVLISLVLASLIALMVIQCFLTIKKTWFTQVALSRIAANRLFFNHYLGNAIHQAGHMGCTSMRSHLTLFGDEEKLAYLLGEQAVQVLTYSQLYHNPLVSKSIYPRLSKEQPILWIKYLDELSQVHAFDFATGYAVLNEERRWPKGTYVMFSDCAASVLIELTQESHFNRTTDTTTIHFKPPEPIWHPFNVNIMQVGRLESSLYFIADNQRQTDQAAKRWSLYEANLYGSMQELIEGLEYWQLRLLKDPGHESSNPLGVKIEAVFHSIDGVRPNHKSFQFLDYEVNDRLLHVSHSQTWLIRGWA